MWQQCLGIVAAGGGALLHVGFAYKETLGWGLPFVRKVAPSWVKDLDPTLAEDRVSWAKQLAFNVGAYNLVLALGLGWTCWAFLKQPNIAGPLGIFFAFWLLAAAGAAFYTKVFPAFALQGSVGVALLIAVICA